MTSSLQEEGNYAGEAQNEKRAIRRRRSVIAALLLFGAPSNLLLLILSLVFRSYGVTSLSLLLWATLLISGVFCNRRGWRQELLRTERLNTIERLYSQVQREHLLSDYLRKLTASMALELHSDALLEQITGEICEMGYAACCLLQLKTVPDGSRWLSGRLASFGAAAGSPILHFPLPDDTADMLHTQTLSKIETGLPLPCEEDIQKALHDLQITRRLALPIRYQGEPLGVLMVWSSPEHWGQMLNEGQEENRALLFDSPPEEAQSAEPEAFAHGALAFLSALADHAALALGNTRLLEQMREAYAHLEEQRQAAAAQAEAVQQMNVKLLLVQTELEAQYRALELVSKKTAELATTDGMTGLANHRAFQEELNRQISRARRAKSPVSLMLLDVDYFKQYNDTYGHPAGDEILKGVGRILQSVVREGDFSARYGGEEFAVILPDTVAESALIVAERIRTSIAQQSFPHRSITVSIGVTTSLPGEINAAVIQRADVALYEAKSAGRNCVKSLFSEDMETSAAEEFGEEDMEKERRNTPPVNLAAAAEEDRSRAIPSSAGLPAILDFSDERLVALNSLDGSLEGLLQEPPGLILAELLDVLDYRHEQPPGHSERVMRYALRLGQSLAALYDEQRAMRPLLPRLTSGDMANLAFGAMLHDIGKSGIPASTLRKISELTDEEWRQIRRHPLVGAELLTGRPLLARALPVVRFHHERWDGSGYPQGLSGEAIPLEARIFAVCDTLDTLLNDKPYRPRLDFAAAAAEIACSAGTQFDPDVVAAFLRVSEHEWLALNPYAALPSSLSGLLPKAA